MNNQTRNMADSYFKIRLICECGIMVALATVLSFIKVYEAPFGGSVTLVSALPIMLLSMRRGVKTGLAAGFVYSVLQLLFGLGTVAYIPDAAGIVICIFTDYIIPFTLYGLCGAFRSLKLTKNENADRLINFIIGAVVVMLIRYASHIISGAVVWYSLSLVQEWYADDPDHIIFKYGAWAYSVVYNAGYMIPEAVITVIATAVVAPVKALFDTKQVNKI